MSRVSPSRVGAMREAVAVTESERVASHSRRSGRAREWSAGVNAVGKLSNHFRYCILDSGTTTLFGENEIGYTVCQKRIISIRNIPIQSGIDTSKQE